MPIDELLTLEEEEKINQLKNRVREITSQISQQELNAISFSFTLLPLIQKYVEPYLPQSIVYHIWDDRLYLDSSNFQNNFKSFEYLKKNKIKTVLIKTKTAFEW
jgi:hypothetical protein